MRLRRLTQMGLAEIADRGRQETAKWLDRLVPVMGPGRLPPGGPSLRVAPDGSGATAALELFRHAAPRRFFPGVETGSAADLLREEVPAVWREIVASASELGSRQLDLLGYSSLTLGEPIDWHSDLVSGRRAPLRHWSRINPLDAAAIGDSKVIWELNRHQWLLPLAQAYWLTADRRYADEAIDVVDDWCRANPYGVGINWASSLEVSLRLITWSWAFMLMRDAEALSEAEFGGLRSQIRAHARHIERYLSRYFSPNTHLTGEALGLFYASVLFPEMAESTRWRRLGRQILIEECRRQVHPDGVHFEQTTCYQRYTVDIYLHFLILAARNEVAVPRDVRDRVVRMVEFLAAVCGPDGAMPQIGDADGGWLLPLMRRRADDCRGTLATAAVVFDRSDVLPVGDGAGPEVLWLLGVPGWERLRRLRQEQRNPPASVFFRDGGYVVMRGGEGPREGHQMIVDVGPLGCSISGAHGHADLLSVQCLAFGEPYVVDPGTYCYTASEAWRDHFRSTQAHSTVVVDRTSQAQPRGPFAWRERPAVRVRAWSTSEALDIVDAWHDAFAGLRDPVRHRRRVVFVKPRYWVIVDDLDGRAQHDVQVRFQLAPKRVRRGAASWLAVEGRRGEGLWIGALSSVPVSVALHEGESDPQEGWVAPVYGRRRPAPMLIFETTGVLPLRIVTMMWPVRRLERDPPRVTPVRDAAGRVIGVECEGMTLWVDESGVRLEPGPVHEERPLTLAGRP